MSAIWGFKPQKPIRFISQVPYEPLSPYYLAPL